jgi:hypothetical protein
MARSLFYTDKLFSTVAKRVYAYSAENGDEKVLNTDGGY